MKHVIGLLGVIAAAVLLSVSGAMNWQFGTSLGTTQANSQIFGFASVASDGLKALLPFFIFAAVRNRSWSQVTAGGTLWIICLAFSLTSALGFSAMNRKDSTGTRAVQATTYQDLRADLLRSRERLGWIPEHRPAAMVAAKMDAMRQNRRWRATSACTNATRSKSIAFCQSYHQLAAEVAAAREASKIETQIASVKAQLAVVPSGVTSNTVADPQSHTLAKLFGQDESVVQMALICLMALLVEFGSALGFYVVFSQWKIYDERNPIVVARPRTRESANDNRSVVTAPAGLPTAAPAAVTAAVHAPKFAAPENDVERFYRDRVEVAEGCSLTATALYENYCEWCDELSKEPLALPTFGRQFGDLGINKAKIAGRIRYIGIRLNSAAGDDERKAPLGRPLGVAA